MSKPYLKKDRLKFGFLWMFIFAGASYLVSLIGINWLATTLMIFAGLSVITGLFGTNDDSKNEKVLMCPKCQIGNQMFNLNNNPESTIFIYNQHQPETRASDGLHVYPLICFMCKKITEWAADTANLSGHATYGFEYFKTKKITKKDLDAAIKEAKINSNEASLKKLKKL